MKTLALYNQDGTLSTEAQSLLSGKPTDMSTKEWRSMFKDFRACVTIEEYKQFKRLSKLAHIKKYYEKMDPEKKKEQWRNCRNNNVEKAKAREVRSRNKRRKKAQIKSAEYRAANPEKIKISNKSWYLNNRETEMARRKEYALKHPEKIKNQRRKSNQKHKEKNYIRHKQRLKTDSMYAAQHKLRTTVSSAFLRIKKDKPTNTLQLLGCTWEQAKKHIESLFEEGMTWENHGLGDDKWHIDHVRPVCSFKDHELHQMNHISNLRPLWQKDNLDKICLDKKLSIRNED